MRRGRKNMRCSRCCSHAPPMPGCLSVSAHCAAMRARSEWRIPRSQRRRSAPMSSASSANISISSSVSGAGSFCLTDLIISPASCTRARLRAHLGKLGLERTPDQAEPEDHAAILCEIMAGLASRRFPAPAGSDRELFEQHLAPWIGRFFADLEQADAADFYRGVGRLGRVFIDIETDAFALPS